MAVRAVVDTAALALLDALDAVRSTPPPAGLEAERLGVLAHASAELQGVYLRELAAVDAAAHGARGAADLLHDTAGVPLWQARRDHGLARRLARFPGLADAVAGGGVELASGLLLVRLWQALPGGMQDSELAEALLTLAGLVDHADLRRKVDELLGALAPDVTDEGLADAREQASLSLRDVGATTVGEFTCDRLTGEFLRQVLHAKAEADRVAATASAESPDPKTAGSDGAAVPGSGKVVGGAAGMDTGRRLLEALVAILDAAVEKEVVPGDPRLVIVTTVDDLARAHEEQPDRVDPQDALTDLFAGTGLLDEGAHASDPERPGDQADAATSATPLPRPSWSTRSRGGVPIGPRTLAALHCTSLFTRLVLSPLGHPVDSSPQRRQLNRAERRALEHRAGYRCQRRGCGRAAYLCVPHHVEPWALGGPSTLANTVLLCPSCHHLLHDRQQPLLLTDGTRIGPRGWLTSARPGADPPF